MRPSGQVARLIRPFLLRLGPPSADPCQRAEQVGAQRPPATARSATARPGLAGPGPAARPAAPAPEIASLTEREREVVTLVAAGLSNDEIAARLVVSPLTAKTHVSRAMIKLAARDRAQLVVIAYSTGLADPGNLPPERLTPNP